MSSTTTELLDTRVELHLKPFVHFGDEVGDVRPGKDAFETGFEVGVGCLANCGHPNFSGFGEDRTMICPSLGCESTSGRHGRRPLSFLKCGLWCGLAACSRVVSV